MDSGYQTNIFLGRSIEVPVKIAMFFDQKIDHAVQGALIKGAGTTTKINKYLEITQKKSQTWMSHIAIISDIISHNQDIPVDDCHSHAPPLGHRIDDGIFLRIRGVQQGICLDKLDLSHEELQWADQPKTGISTTETHSHSHNHPSISVSLSLYIYIHIHIHISSKRKGYISSIHLIL